MPKNLPVKDKAPGDVDYTLDGHPITPGMRVWDYDLDATTVVGPNANGIPDEVQWYDMANGKLMDGHRLRVHHPSTGTPA